MNSINILKKGQLIYISHGEYSDYSIIGHFLVLKELIISKQSLLDIVRDVNISDYLREELEEGGIYISSQMDELIHILVSKGYLEEIDIQEVYNLIEAL